MFVPLCMLTCSPHCCCCCYCWCWCPARVLANGYGLNHSALSVHRIARHSGDIYAFANELVMKGFDMNTEGGIIKVGPWGDGGGGVEGLPGVQQVCQYGGEALLCVRRAGRTCRHAVSVPALLPPVLSPGCCPPTPSPPPLPPGLPTRRCRLMPACCSAPSCPT